MRPEVANPMRFLVSLSDAILDRSPEELIGAMLIAAAVAVIVAGLYTLARKKSSPSPTFVGGLGLAAGASCMALSAGYLEYAGRDWTSGAAVSRVSPARRPSGAPDRAGLPPPWTVPGMGWSSGIHVIATADENRDGLLTPDEAARLVRNADQDGDGAVNFRDIDRLIAERFRPSRQPYGLTTAGPGDRGGSGGRPE